MNNIRRNELLGIINKLESIIENLDSIKIDETDARDSIPENFQNSDNYMKADNTVSQLEDALDSLQTALDCIQEASE